MTSPPRMTFRRAYPPARPHPGPSHVLLFQRSRLVVDERLQLPIADRDRPGPLPLELVGDLLYLGDLDGVPCSVGAWPDRSELPAGFRALGLPELHGMLPDEAFGVAIYGFLMARWARLTRFCPTCAGELAPQAGDFGRACTGCGRPVYPHVHPCVIVLIHDGHRLLLAHKKGFGPMWGLVAGFVEPGESIEACVQREVAEEVGLEVGELEWFGSQPWPFPNQLMLGFFARCTGGSLKLDEDELDDARWFDPADLPLVPPDLSIARRLIDTWVARRKAVT